MNENSPICARGLTKAYSQGSARIEVLAGAEIDVSTGERLAIVGQSGSGKSTLLHILAGLLDPDRGSVCVMGEDLTAANPAKRAELRNAHMGFVYQFHHLLPEFTALENVAMPRLVGGAAMADVVEDTRVLLESVGLSARASHRPHELSGGERQRVAVARALAGRPRVVLADEPTGNLDRRSAERVLEVIDRLVGATGVAFVVVTHDERLAARLDRTLVLRDGVLT